MNAKAMPVVLANSDQYAEWLEAPATDVEAIQARVLPTEALNFLTDEEAEVFAPPPKIGKA